MKLTSADVITSRLKFNSHTVHNPNCDILELTISRDAFITYCIDINTKAECMEYYSGKNYVVNSTAKSQSRMYPKLSIPKKYKAVWNALQYSYQKNYCSIPELI